MTQETDWFPGTVLPVRKGYYKVRNHPESPLSAANRLNSSQMRYWSGQRWEAWKDGNESLMNARSKWYQWNGLAVWDELKGERND